MIDEILMLVIELLCFFWQIYGFCMNLVRH